jgi:hypothetical protein
MWLPRKANPLYGPPEKRGEWTLGRFQVKYLLLIARLRWWWVCGDSWLWIIIWIVIVIS